MLSVTLQQVSDNISKSIQDFDKHRSQLIATAYKQGGNDAVSNLLDKYDSLRNTFFDFIDLQLDATNPQLATLLTQANTITSSLDASVKSISNVNNALTLLDKTINILGGIITIASAV